MFVLTAVNVEEYRGYVDERMETLRKMGHTLRVLDVAEVTPDEAARIIADCECLWVSGGNTFYLLQELRRAGLVDLIAARTREGMAYIGESAGAIIACPDIEYVHHMDERALAPGLADCTGMGLVDRYVLPHNGEFPFGEAIAEIRAAYESEIDLVPLDNNQVLVVDGDGRTVMTERW